MESSLTKDINRKKRDKELKLYRKLNAAFKKQSLDYRRIVFLKKRLDYYNKIKERRLNRQARTVFQSSFNGPYRYGKPENF